MSGSGFLSAAHVRFVGLHRSTMRLAPAPVTSEETELRAWLRRFSVDRPRWGWRRAAKMARRAGWKVKNKRIRRLWREEGLRVLNVASRSG